MNQKSNSLNCYWSQLDWCREKTPTMPPFPQFSILFSFCGAVQRRRVPLFSIRCHIHYCYSYTFILYSHIFLLIISLSPFFISIQEAKLIRFFCQDGFTLFIIISTVKKERKDMMFDGNHFFMTMRLVVAVTGSVPYSCSSVVYTCSLFSPL